MWGGFPKKNEPCSGYLLEHNGFSLLLDCGSGVLTKLQEFKDLNDIHDIVLSHYHYDHASDVGAYLFSRLVNTQLGRVEEPLTIYGPNDARKEEEYTRVPHSQFQGIIESSVLSIGPFHLTFLKNIHPVETYSVKIVCEGKMIVYTADTQLFEGLVDFSKDADLLITECSLYEGMDGASSGHMNAQEAGMLAESSRAKRTLLTHLPHYGELQELVTSARSVGGSKIDLAKVGLELIV